MGIFPVILSHFAVVIRKTLFGELSERSDMPSAGITAMHLNGNMLSCRILFWEVVLEGLVTTVMMARLIWTAECGGQMQERTGLRLQYKAILV